MIFLFVFTVLSLSLYHDNFQNSNLHNSLLKAYAAHHVTSSKNTPHRDRFLENGTLDTFTRLHFVFKSRSFDRSKSSTAAVARPKNKRMSHREEREREREKKKDVKYIHVVQLVWKLFESCIYACVYVCVYSVECAY